MSQNTVSWLKLDNAAKIYPAAMRRNWMAMFRFSADLTEPVEPEILEEALRGVMARFPGFSVRLRRGVFWFYLEHMDKLPPLMQDVSNPLLLMNLKETGGFLFRVRYYGCRIACEFFHVVTDGTGGLCFLKTLTAEYLRIKYGADIPRGADILDCREAPKPEELEDSFLKYAKSESRSRKEPDAWHIIGADEPPDVIHITTGIIPVNDVLSRAREKGVTLTEYLTSVLIMSIDTLQRRYVKRQSRLKPVKICVPVNLRAFFPSTTLRNFSLYINPGIEPRLGVYSFDEILNSVHHQMAIEATRKNLGSRFTANVNTEKSRLLRLTPLFLKNIVMKAVFEAVGDRKTSSTITNLGVARLPDEMSRYIKRMDVVLGPLSRNHVVSASLSYNNTLYYTFTRVIKDNSLEREFFRNLVKLGIHVKIESNNQYQSD